MEEACVSRSILSSFLSHLHKEMASDPHAFFKKRGDIAIASVRLSVRPSRYLLLNNLTKSNQIWFVSCSHEWVNFQDF